MGGVSSQSAPTRKGTSRRFGGNPLARHAMLATHGRGRADLGHGVDECGDGGGLGGERPQPVLAPDDVDGEVRPQCPVGVVAEGARQDRMVGRRAAAHQYGPVAGVGGGLGSARRCRSSQCGAASGAGPLPVPLRLSPTLREHCSRSLRLWFQEGLACGALGDGLCRAMRR